MSLLSASFCCFSDKCDLTRDCWCVSFSELSQFFWLPLKFLCNVFVTYFSSELSFISLRDRCHCGFFKLPSMSLPLQRFCGVLSLAHFLWRFYSMNCSIVFAVILAGRLLEWNLEKTFIFDIDLLFSCLDCREKWFISFRSRFVLSWPFWLP